MRAGELASPFPTVRLDTPAMAAAWLLADERLPGLIVVDAMDRPSTILPGSQVLRMAVPRYPQEDPALARVIDEAAADLFSRQLRDRTVARCLPAERRELPVVDQNATVLEVAALMARTRSPVAAVTTPMGRWLGRSPTPPSWTGCWPRDGRRQAQGRHPGRVPLIAPRRCPGGRGAWQNRSHQCGNAVADNHPSH